MYLGAGIFCGTLMHLAIPSLNPLGVGYIAVTWPYVLHCGPATVTCANVTGPGWLQPYMFPFD